MAHRGIISSLLIAILVAVIVFFCIYFFAPAFSERFLGGLSWNRQQTGLPFVQYSELKRVSNGIKDLLDASGISFKDSKALQEKLKDPQVLNKATDALTAGKDQVIAFVGAYL